MQSKNTHNISNVIPISDSMLITRGWLHILACWSGNQHCYATHASIDETGTFWWKTLNTHEGVSKSF